MRILHIINDADSGGAQTLLETLGGAWPASDDLHLVVLMGPDVLSDRLDNRFDSVRYLGLTRSGRNLLPVARALQRRVDDLEPNILHSHLLQSDLLALTVRAPGTARVSTVHTTGFTTADPRRSRLIAHVVGRSSHRFQGLAATDASCLPYMAAHHYRPPDRVILNAAAACSTAPYEPASTTLLHLARWHPVKGHDVLFRAFHRFVRDHPGWNLVCAGSGVRLDAADVRRSLAAAGFDPAADDLPVTLCGARSDVGPLLERAAALVISSRYGEAMPMAGIEALRSGVPVIATDVGGSAAFVLDPRLLVAPGRPDTLSRAFADFADLTAEQRRTLSIESSQRAATNFSVQDCVDRYRELYSASRDKKFRTRRSGPVHAV